MILQINKISISKFFFSFIMKVRPLKQRPPSSKPIVPQNRIEAAFESRTQDGP